MDKPFPKHDMTIKVGFNKDTNEVLVDFGKPVRWFAMERTQGIQFAIEIIKAAGGTVHAGKPEDQSN